MLRDTAGPDLGGISGQCPGLAHSAGSLPRRERPEAISASTLVVQRAANTFLMDSLNCSDTAGMEKIKSSGLMPESRDEFPPHREGENWDPLLAQAGRGHHPSCLARPSFLPVVPFCVVTRLFLL